MSFQNDARITAQTTALNHTRTRRFQLLVGGDECVKHGCKILFLVEEPLEEVRVLLETRLDVVNELTRAWVMFIKLLGEGLEVIRLKASAVTNGLVRPVC